MQALCQRQSNTALQVTVLCSSTTIAHEHCPFGPFAYFRLCIYSRAPAGLRPIVGKKLDQSIDRLGFLQRKQASLQGVRVFPFIKNEEMGSTPSKSVRRQKDVQCELLLL